MGAQITVQTPSQQHKGTELRSEGAQGGAKPFGLIHTKHRQRKTISNSDEEKHRFPVKESRFESSPSGNQRLSQVSAEDPAATTLTTRCPADSH